MSNNTMPERISAYISGNGLGCFELHPRVPLTTEYIRADVAQAQIDAERKRVGRYNLLALRKATDDACAAAYLDCVECRDDAVNWEDFKCIGAEWFVDDDGVPGHRVWVDEADPAAYRLREFVAGYLERAGFAGVHVVLEW
jgi:hypothetical protein